MGEAEHEPEKAHPDVTRTATHRSVRDHPSTSLANILVSSQRIAHDDKHLTQN